jgi:hypothetical protein
LLRITDRDHLTVVDVDRGHPESVDEDAVAASIDGHPVAVGEPQHQILGCTLAGLARVFQPEVALTA